jgi:capsular exopolysaccharide synthesis family protein
MAGLAISWWIYLSATKVYEFKATIMMSGNPSQLNVFDKNYASSNIARSNYSLYMVFLNRMIVLGLPTNILRTVETLDFDVQFFTKTRFSENEIYPILPYTVDIDINHPQALGVDYEVMVENNGSLKLKAKSSNGVILHDYSTGRNLTKYGKVDEIIVVSGNGLVKTEYCAFIIQRNPEYDSLQQARPGMSPVNTETGIADTQSKTVFFRFYNHQQLASQFRDMQVKEVEQYATTAHVKLQAPSRLKGMIFLNQHLDRWLQEELELKNRTAVNTLGFINQQLLVIQDTLREIKGRIEQFRHQHDVILLERQVSDLYLGRKTTEETLIKLRNKRDHLLQVKQYVKLRAGDTELIAPVLADINSIVLTDGVTNLIKTRSQLYTQQGRQKDHNPVIDELKKDEKMQLSFVQEALKELENYNSNEILLTERQLQEFIVEQNALPALEQEYLELQRTFDLNNDLYNLLRRRKVETEVMKASATSDSRVIEYASEGVQIAPKRVILLAGLLGGLTLPVVVIVMLHLLNVKIHDDEDIHQLTNLPIIGHIIRNDINTALVTYDHPATPVTETFRALRSSFNFILRGEHAQVILFTSSTAGEGKTFCALNMAGLFAMAGKNTILLGFDLRKHGLNNYLAITRKPGITEVLIGHKSIEEVRFNYRPNLDILFAGSVPPNPSDLTESDATRELIFKLKQLYDMVIIDTSPVGLVTDALPLATMADLNLFVVRPGYSLKRTLVPTLHQLEKSGVNNIGLVMNDVDPTERHVSYGYGYHANS